GGWKVQRRPLADEAEEGDGGAAPADRVVTPEEACASRAAKIAATPELTAGGSCPAHGRRRARHTRRRVSGCAPARGSWISRSPGACGCCWDRWGCSRRCSSSCSPMG